MSEITTTIPRAAMKALINYAWSDEAADYASAHGIDPDHAVEHARTNHTSDHIYVAMVRVADCLETIKPRPVPTETAA